MPDPDHSPAIDVNIEMAKYRTYAASERTLMTWIRSSLSLITFGFGLSQISQALAQAHPENAARLTPHARVLSFAFVILGIGCPIFAVIQHHIERKRLRAPQYVYREPIALGILSAGIIAGIGGFALVSLILRQIWAPD